MHHCSTYPTLPPAHTRPQAPKTTRCSASCVSLSLSAALAILLLHHQAHLRPPKPPSMRPPTHTHLPTLTGTKEKTMRDLVRVVVVTAALAAPGLAFVPPSSSSRPTRTRVSIHPPKNGIPGTWTKTVLACLLALCLLLFLSPSQMLRVDAGFVHPFPTPSSHSHPSPSPTRHTRP